MKPNLLTLLAIWAFAGPISVLVRPAAAQVVSGAGVQGPPRDQRPALPPQRFVRAAYSLAFGDYTRRVRGIADSRSPRHVYGPDGAGNLLVLSDDGVVSVGPDGKTILRVPAQRLAEAGVGDAAARGPAAMDDDGHLYIVNDAGDVVFIPKQTGGAVRTFLARGAFNQLATVGTFKINDLLVARRLLWIAADGTAGLMKADPETGKLTLVYSPLQDLEAAGRGTTDFGIKALAQERGRAEVLFTLGWDVGGSPEARIAGIDADDLLFRVEPRERDVILDKGALPRGLAALGGGAFAVAQDDGDVYWFNYTPDSVKAMPLEGALNVFRALDKDILGAEDVEPLGLDADCEGRAYLTTSVGIIAFRAAQESLVPGDLLVVNSSRDQILRITPFGEPIVFREGGLGQAPGQEAVALQTPSALARSPVDGHIVVADEGARKVFRFSPDGLKLPDYDANLPFQVGFDGEGNLYYLDRKFLKDRDIDPREVQGDYPTVVMRPTAGGRIVLHEFEDGDWDQTAMAVRPDGSVVIAEVWVADVDNSRGRLVSIPAGGGPPEELLALEQPLALHIDADGALWIGERALAADAGGRLLRLAPGATDPDVIMPRPGEVNPLASPAAIAEMEGGRLVVADRLADVYPGATRTGGLFSVQADGSDLRVLLDHPDYPPPNAVGVIHVPPFECASYRDCPAPSCLEDEKVCPPREDCAADALTCPPQEECAEDALACPAGQCTNAGLCVVPVACKLRDIDYGPDEPPPAPAEEQGCLDCAVGRTRTAAASAWWRILLRR